MEKSTLTLGHNSLLTDEGRLATVSIDTDHVASVTIDAIRTVFDRLAHSIKK
jgi:hypothetical protein